MREDKPIKIKYSNNSEYRYEIVKRADGTFRVFAQSKIYDDYYDNNEFIWCDISDYSHITDNYERAEEIGEECIRNLAGML